MAYYDANGNPIAAPGTRRQPTPQELQDALGALPQDWSGQLPGSQGPTADAPGTQARNTWSHPAYTGSDPAYVAWLAQADLSAGDAASAAKLRKAQAQTAYEQALQDIQNQAVSGRRNIQTSMLQRGMFGSGETKRRGMEFDSSVDVSRQRALAAETDQIGQADESMRSTINNLGMQGTQAVSAAMLRDSIAAYNAQQADLAAQAAPQPVTPPTPTYAATAPQAPSYNSQMPAAPAYNPAASSASLFKAQSLPKPKAAAGTTGSLKLARKGLQ